jgi:hypothetical protein
MATKETTDYVCTVCGARGCKLWRQYNTFADRVRLMCCVCAGKDQGVDTGAIDDAGKVHSGIGGGRTDQIGWLVPAVPTDDGTYWGYTSVPADAVAWWRSLPTTPAATPDKSGGGR